MKMDDLTAGLIEWVDLIEAGIGTPRTTSHTVYNRPQGVTEG